MKRTTILSLSLCFFSFFPALSHADIDSDSPVLFSCPTDDGDNLTLKEHEGKLALTLNERIYVSDESVEDVGKAYAKKIERTPEYNVASFHIQGIEYSIGSFKNLATQAEPTGQFFSYSSDENRIPDLLCSFGEEINNLRILTQ